MAGIPERPYQLHLLPCLNVEQAKLFESMFHNRLKEFKTKGKREWFSHPSANRFYKMVAGHTAEILSVFRTFGYETHLESIALNGKQPVSYDIDSLTANELE